MTEAKEQTFRVLRAQAGDRQALDALLRSVQTPLLGYVRSLVSDPNLAEDVLQDVFVLICRKLRWLREPALFRPWAYRIASRRAFRVLQGERKRAERNRAGRSVDDDVEPAVEPPRYDPELIASLPTLLAAVSSSSRAVLSLHYLQEMSLQETADILGIPLGTTKSRLAYGLKALRQLLAKDCAGRAATGRAATGRAATGRAATGR